LWNSIFETGNLVLAVAATFVGVLTDVATRSFAMLALTVTGATVFAHVVIHGVVGFVKSLVAFHFAGGVMDGVILRIGRLLVWPFVKFDVTFRYGAVFLFARIGTLGDRRGAVVHLGCARMEVETAFAVEGHRLLAFRRNFGSLREEFAPTSPVILLLPVVTLFLFRVLVRFVSNVQADLHEIGGLPSPMD
jgi:hypothetical protein